MTTPDAFTRAYLQHGLEVAQAAERQRILAEDPAAGVYRLGLRDGATAERQRIRELAIEHGAHCNCDAWRHVKPFADLLGGDVP